MSNSSGIARVVVIASFVAVIASGLLMMDFLIAAVFWSYVGGMFTAKFIE